MSNINININLPNRDDSSNINEQSKPQLSSLITKIKKCYDWQTLHALTEEFNKIGLSVEKTAQDRFILCKLKDGQPIHNNIIDDFIFVGSASQLTEEITCRNLEIIVEFIKDNNGKPQTRLQQDGKQYSNVGLYGKVVRIDGEKSLHENQEIRFIGKRLIID